MSSLRILFIILSVILILVLVFKPCMFGLSSRHDVSGHEGFDVSLKKEDAEHVDKQKPVDVIASLPTTGTHDCVSNGLVSSEGGAVCLSSSVLDLIMSRGGNVA